MKVNQDDRIIQTLWQKSLEILYEILQKFKLTTIFIPADRMSCSTREFEDFRSQLYKTFDNATMHFCILRTQVILLTKPEDIQQVLEDFHSSPISGHQGVNRMLGRVGHKFKWQGMTKDIKDFVRKCKVCQLTKASRSTKLPMEITSTSRLPFTKISLDIVGPLVTSQEGYSYLLTYQDDLTKFFGAIPIVNEEAETVAEKFVEHVVLRFGVPEIVLTDLGNNFVSDLMSRTFKLLGIKKHNCSPYSPQTNGFVERSHRVLKNILRAYINTDKTDWPKFTPYAVFVMNTTINRSTSYTAMELLYGYKLEIPTNLKKKPEPIYSYDDYLAQLRYRLQSAHKLAREHLIESKEENKRYFDEGTQSISYKVNDKILIKNFNKKTKLHNPYKGPFVITELVSDTNVKYKRGNENVIIHKNHIKKFFESDKNQQNKT